MNITDKNFIYEQTGARCFYDKTRKCWCALWLEDSHEHRLYFGKAYNKFDVIKAITDKRLNEYSFIKQ